MNRLFMVSMNGVLYDSIGRVLEYVRYRWNHIMKPSDVTTNDMARFTGIQEIDIDLVKQLSNPDFYLEMKPKEGVQEALAILGRFGRVVSVTRRPGVARMATRVAATRDFGDAIKEIYHQRNAPKIARALKVSMVVEDNPKIAEEFASSRILTFHPVSQYSGGLKRTSYLKTCKDLLDAAKMYEQAFTRTSWSD
jgi:5'(3')-deoxyribonucleotidase